MTYLYYANNTPWLSYWSSTISFINQKVRPMHWWGDWTIGATTPFHNWGEDSMVAVGRWRSWGDDSSTLSECPPSTVACNNPPGHTFESPWHRRLEVIRLGRREKWSMATTLLFLSILVRGLHDWWNWNCIICACCECVRPYVCKKSDFKVNTRSYILSSYFNNTVRSKVSYLAQWQTTDLQNLMKIDEINFSNLPQTASSARCSWSQVSAFQH